MDVVSVYKCLCDVTRLRILNLLRGGPLCVCHLQSIIEEPQAKMSKQLQYMKRHGLLASSRENNWTIYRLADDQPRLLEENLKCLQDCTGEMPVFREDLARRADLVREVARTHAGAPPGLAAELAREAACCGGEATCGGRGRRKGR